MCCFFSGGGRRGGNFILEYHCVYLSWSFTRPRADQRPDRQRRVEVLGRIKSFMPDIRVDGRHILYSSSCNALRMLCKLPYTLLCGAEKRLCI